MTACDRGTVLELLLQDPAVADLDPVVCAAILDRFGGRATVGFAEAAAILGMDRKTLRTHVRCGNISYYTLGGIDRVRRAFGPRDIAAFYCRRRTVEPPIAPAAPRRGRKRKLEGFMAAREDTGISNRPRARDGSLTKPAIPFG